MYLDILLIVVMLISGMLAMVRGLIREVLSIAGWAAAAARHLYAYAKLLPLAKTYFSNWNDYVVAGGTMAGAFLLTLDRRVGHHRSRFRTRFSTAGSARSTARSGSCSGWRAAWSSLSSHSHFSTGWFPRRSPPGSQMRKHSLCSRRFVTI